MSEKEAMIDPFLLEALQNPRHRLTILRMELEIQKFFQNPNQQQFEFQSFPTSYLRLAAHRVAHHYKLFSDSSENIILVTKTLASKYPNTCLSEIPVNQPEISKPKGLKIEIKTRPNRGGTGLISNGSRVEKNLLRSVEERKEEYEKARARIFNNPTMAIHSNSLDVVKSSGRIAIVRDREKDRCDPDYDRNRFVRVMSPGQNLNPVPVQFPLNDVVFPQLSRTQASLDYRESVNQASSNTEWASPNASNKYLFRNQNP